MLLNLTQCHLQYVHTYKTLADIFIYLKFFIFSTVERRINTKFFWLIAYFLSHTKESI